MFKYLNPHFYISHSLSILKQQITHKLLIDEGEQHSAAEMEEMENGEKFQHSINYIMTIQSNLDRYTKHKQKTFCTSHDPSGF